MNKKWLAKVISEDTGLPLTESEAIIEILFDNITFALQSEGSILIPNFGTFKISERKARKGINPATREPIDIPASKSISFKVSKKLKEKINN